MLTLHSLVGLLYRPVVASHLPRARPMTMSYNLPVLRPAARAVLKARRLSRACSTLADSHTGADGIANALRSDPHLLDRVLSEGGSELRRRVLATRLLAPTPPSLAYSCSAG